MSLSPSAQRAVQWLEQQVADLAGIRNATPRDPSFKNWRQASLTTLQRIWPGDQERSERFRRIPFSPVDPRADARTVREWYSRGCQEAARVLSGFIEDVRRNGVTEEVAADAAVPEVSAEVDFETDFPTVDLPAGDLSAIATEPAAATNAFADFVDDVPQAAAADAPAPPSLPSGIPAISNTAPEVHAHDARQVKKGVGARLKDLLGFAQLSAKALAGFPRDAAAPSSLPSLDAPVAPTLPSMDVMPLGGVVGNAQGRVSLPSPAARTPAEQVKHAPKPGEPVPKAPPKLAVSLPDTTVPQPDASASGLWPLPQPQMAAAPAPATPAASPQPPTASQPPAASEPGMSVVMSRPTTLRGAIEKVSIESLLSDQFRGPSTGGPAAAASAPKPEALEKMVDEMLSAEAAAKPAPPAPTASPGAPAVPPSAGRPAPPEPPVIPLFGQVQSAPQAAMPAPDTAAPVPLEDFEPGIPGIPDPDELEDAADASSSDPAVQATRAAESFMQLPPRHRDPQAQTAGDDSAVGKVDPDAFARATEDFLQSSPVLGAAGRKVSRPIEDTGFNDPDAIAVASMMQELARLDVPAGRQPEVRARLLDLARRIEKGDLDWTMLRKAVWFAMEYPEIARRLMPVLLPWIDRAA